MPRFLWTQKQNIGPKPRFGHAMAYDSDRKRVVLFGGDSLRSHLFSDTWEWDGENWTQMADIGPRPRKGFAMVYDGARRRVLLFGGGAGTSVLGDTWQWDGEDWAQIADSGPGSRGGHAMAFDSARSRVVMFGGESPNSHLLGDTWEWDGEEWTQQEDTGPSARRDHAMAYDSTRRRIVLFGGNPGTGSGLGDTWEWDGTSWTQLAGFGADPCLGAATVFEGDRVALFGGIDSIAASPAPLVFGNTWEWDGKHWTQRQDIGPGPRWLHAMAYDNIRRRIVLFGGLPVADQTLADHLLGDTWEHLDRRGGSGATLTSLTLSPSVVSPGETTTATVTLDGPAPAGGLTVRLAVPGQLVSEALPADIAMPENATVGQLPFRVTLNVTPGDHRIEATLAGVVQSAMLTIR
jgi:hypothetical protein